MEVQKKSDDKIIRSSPSPPSPVRDEVDTHNLHVDDDVDHVGQQSHQPPRARAVEEGLHEEQFPFSPGQRGGREGNTKLR